MHYTVLATNMIVQHSLMVGGGGVSLGRTYGNCFGAVVVHREYVGQLRTREHQQQPEPVLADAVVDNDVFDELVDALTEQRFESLTLSQPVQDLFFFVGCYSHFVVM